jgi:membrane protease YdiL (CAAX protease family)
MTSSSPLDPSDDAHLDAAGAAAPPGAAVPLGPSAPRRIDREGDGIDASDVVAEVRDDVRESFVPVVVVLGVLVAVNLLTNRFAPDLYLLWAWTGVAALLLIARRDGESWIDLGLGRVPRKAWYAAAAVIAVILVAYLIGAALPATREAFGDDRVEGLSSGEILVRALVRVPLGTVLLEEVAFRGVLLAMLWRRMGVGRGVVISSLVFGLWHILPSLGITQSNEALGAAVGSGDTGQALGVLFAVVSTTIAGLIFCELRRRFGHLIVPMALHWATNGLGYLFAWALVTGRFPGL